MNNPKLAILDRYFKITERGSSLRIELLAGLSSFLSLAYILIVNPAILSQAGIDPTAVLFATAIGSGLSCLLMGFWARLPFVLAPGLEMNAFVTFSAVAALGLTWQQTLGLVFWSGALCVLLTYLPIRQKIISALPRGLQANLAFSVGIFVLTIGLFLSKIVTFKDSQPVGFGNFISSEAISLYLGLGLCIVCRHFIFSKSIFAHFVRQLAFLIAMLVAAMFCLSQGIKTESTAVGAGKMFEAVFALEFFPFLHPQVWTVLLVLFLIDFYGSIGKFIGLTSSTNLRDRHGEVLDLKKAMYVDGAGTMFGAVLGTSSIITYVESAIGIHAGGRTGIVAIVCGLLMILSLIFTPLISLIPVVATAGVLVYVAYALLPREDWKSSVYTRFDLFVGIGMAILSFATFSLDKAMLFGFGAYVLKEFKAKGANLNKYLLASFVLLLIGVSLQYYLK